MRVFMSHDYNHTPSLIVLKFGMKIAYLVEQRMCNDFIFLPFRIAAILWVFSQLRSNALTDCNEIWTI